MRTSFSPTYKIDRVIIHFCHLKSGNMQTKTTFLCENCKATVTSQKLVFIRVLGKIRIIFLNFQANGHKPLPLPLTYGKTSQSKNVS